MGQAPIRATHDRLISVLKDSALESILLWSTIYSVVFIEDEAFHRRRMELLEESELFALMDWLEAYPGSGKIIPHSGGLRKLRWALAGRGKRGGARVIYFWWLADAKILLLDIYAKNEKEDLGAVELKKLKTKVKP